MPGKETILVKLMFVDVSGRENLNTTTKETLLKRQKIVYKYKNSQTNICKWIKEQER